MRITRKDGSFLAKLPSGYRFTLFGGALGCLLTLIVNLGITIWALKLPAVDGADNPGRRVLHEGSCRTSQTLDTALHVIINILSTVLLASSNYGIQCLSAPTRTQVDEAHKSGSWLDIGILSVRNICKLPVKQRVLWLLLVLSSVPLHLL